MKHTLKIGLTMRRSDACDYVEPREGIALSWKTLIKKVLPDAIWVPLPSIGKEVVKTVQNLGLNGIILTGGETPGTDHERDETENALVTFCINSGIPILGICRGMQFLQVYFGGELSHRTRLGHVGTRHKIFFEESSIIDKGSYEVNSFHKHGIKADLLAPEFRIIAIDEENFVEACASINHNIIGIMWHPEREIQLQEVDRLLFCNVFNKPQPHDEQFL